MCSVKAIKAPRKTDNAVRRASTNFLPKSIKILSAKGWSTYSPCTDIDFQFFNCNVDEPCLSHIGLNVFAVPINIHVCNNFVQISIKLELAMEVEGSTSRSAEFSGTLVSEKNL